MNNTHQVAILGGGNGAHTLAAEMSHKGYSVRMFEMPQFKDKLQKLFDTKEIEVTGIESYKAKIDVVTDDIDEAISGVKYIVVLTPAFAHAGYAHLLKGHVTKDQVVITIPGAFAALQMRKIIEDAGCEIPVFADVNNLPYDTRLSGPCRISLFGRNKINISFLPAEAGDELIDEMREIFFPFERVYDDVLECGLSIVNPTFHTGPCLLSVTDIERPTVNFFVYEHGFTPSACKVNIQLDKERKAVGAALGYDLHPNEDFTGMPKDYTWQQLYAQGHGAIELTPICGPNNIFDRYLTEDCPYGLVPWASIGEMFDVPMPTTNSCINIYNIIHECDWRANGMTIADLGIEGMSKEEILSYVKTGIKG